MLPPTDQEDLNDHSSGHTVQVDSGMICILVPAFPLGPGYDRASADLLLRLSPGYPDVPPDMWWFDPPVRRTDGQEIPATQVTETYLGRSWQRWSRHLQPGQWRSGIDGVRSYLALICSELRAASPVNS